MGKISAGANGYDILWSCSTVGITNEWIFRGEKYWLACPTIQIENGIGYCDGLQGTGNGGRLWFANGYVTGIDGVGFRPVVKLKSSVTLKSEDEGETYKIEI